MKGSLIIVGFFVLGTICGVCHLLPFDIAETNISYYALCALMFSVGLSVGNDPQTLKNFRSLNPRLVFLPIMTILGTLAGSAAVSLILTHRSITDCLAVGSGFGYYSLSSVLIADLKSATLGVQGAAELAVSGVTSMDVCLPSIARYSGSDLVPLAILHGIVLEVCVPILVGAFC